MSHDADFERFARNSTTGMMIGLREMGGATFTESDRRALVDGLEIIRTVAVQPFGATEAASGRGGYTGAEYERAKMQVVAAAMQLWSSGKLDGIQVDGEEGA